MLGVFDKDGRLAKVIGKIVNIDEKKKELQQLKKMAVMDSATGVLQQTDDRRHDRGVLKKEKASRASMLCWSLILMISRKSMMTTVTDWVMRSSRAVGAEINHLFRTSDIKGRIGGDEFMILIKDVEGMGFITDKAHSICRIFEDREIEPGKKNQCFHKYRNCNL